MDGQGESVLDGILRAAIDDTINGEVASDLAHAYFLLGLVKELWRPSYMSSILCWKNNDGMDWAGVVFINEDFSDDSSHAIWNSAWDQGIVEKHNMTTDANVDFFGQIGVLFERLCTLG